MASAAYACRRQYRLCLKGVAPLRLARVLVARYALAKPTRCRDGWLVLRRVLLQSLAARDPRSCLRAYRAA